jgi:hypothetical protein
VTSWNCGELLPRPPPLLVLLGDRVALPEGGERYDWTMTPDGWPATARAR